MAETSDQTTPRRATHTRETGETRISLELVLDGRGKGEIATGVGFFDHMLTLLAFHAGWDLGLRAEGDLHIDAHHTVEDAGIALGQAIRAAIGDGRGIARFGSAYVPLNESLGRVVVDVCGRAHLEYCAPMPTPTCGTFPVELGEEFFRALAMAGGITLHADLLRCRNSHHGLEVLFKAGGRALADGLAQTDGGVRSTKGSLHA